MTTSLEVLCSPERLYYRYWEGRGPGMFLEFVPKIAIKMVRQERLL